MLRSRRGDCWGLSTWDPITIAKATFDLNLPLTPLKRHSALIIDKPHTYSDTYEHSPSRDNVLKVSDFDLKWRACKIFKPFDLCVGLCWSYRLPHRPGEPPPPPPWTMMSSGPLVAIILKIITNIIIPHFSWLQLTMGHIILLLLWLFIFIYNICQLSPWDTLFTSCFSFLSWKILTSVDRRLPPKTLVICHKANLWWMYKHFPSYDLLWDLELCRLSIWPLLTSHKLSSLPQ